MSSLRRGMPGLRHAAAGVAESGRMGLLDLPGLRCAADAVPGTRGGDDAGAVGGGQFEVYGRVRSGSDPVAEGGERAGGGAADAAELERGGRHHAAGRGAGAGAPPGAGGTALVGGRDGLSPAPPVRDRGVESEEGDRAVCGTGARKTSAEGVLRGSGEGPPRRGRECLHGHVGPVHRGHAGDDSGSVDEDRVRSVPCGQAPRRRGGQGAARGAPGAREGGKRNPHGVEVPVAEGPRAKDAPGEAGVRQAARRHAAHGRGLGAEGSGSEPLALQEPDLGDRRMEPVARLGVALPPGPGRQSRPHGPRAPLGHRQRRDLRCDQRTRRRHQQPDQDDQGARSRGFRNQERFANAIYFHLGGLDLYPDGLTHDQSPT